MWYFNRIAFIYLKLLCGDFVRTLEDTLSTTILGYGFMLFLCSTLGQEYAKECSIVPGKAQKKTATW